jgi:hypothetical protein
MSLVGFFASGITILAGFLISLTVIWVSSDTPERDTALLLAVFGVITAFPVWALRKPKNPLELKERRRWRWPWRRRKKSAEASRLVWKRRRGQSQNRPFGTTDVPQPSTFVRSPRKPTGS